MGLQGADEPPPSNCTCEAGIGLSSSVVVSIAVEFSAC